MASNANPRGVCNCTSGFALQTDGHCPSSGPPKRACGRRAPWPPRHENKSLGPARGTTPQSPAVTAPLKGEPKHIAEFPVKFIMASTTRPRNGQDRSLQSSLYCVVDIKLTCRAGCPVKRNIGNSRERRWVTVCGYGAE